MPSASTPDPRPSLIVARKVGSVSVMKPQGPKSLMVGGVVSPPLTVM